MSDIQALAAHAAGAQLLPFRYSPGPLGPFDVEVRITHCGVCHSDIHLIDNDWTISRYPLVPGHEIIGTVVALGSAVHGHSLGQRVGIGWQADSCGICEWCRSAEEHLCPKAQPTCVGRHGGFAECVRVNSRFAVPIPASLESLTAAPLLCGGVTVYSPLRNHNARPASRIGVIGIGGLGHLAIQFARAFGSEVTAFSSSKDKEAEALSLGAHAFVNTRETAAVKKLARSLDLILSTVSGDQDLVHIVEALRPKGTLVVLGAGPSPLQISGASLIGGQLTVAGSNIGSPRDIREMLEVAARHNIKAVTERFPMKDANTAVSRVRKNQVRYRAVLTA
ncbi:MAG TPA: NAD(P)-dependent alcohol dehydrogenase [Candidatus Aquilonibacter sp.]|nr:NAD(P)-dependent alcohol dehydrogenase [Candidatus Aquilonibacter sp.]